MPESNIIVPEADTTFYEDPTNQRTDIDSLLGGGKAKPPAPAIDPALEAAINQEDLDGEEGDLEEEDEQENTPTLEEQLTAPPPSKRTTTPPDAKDTELAALRAQLAEMQANLAAMDELEDLDGLEPTPAPATASPVTKDFDLTFTQDQLDDMVSDPTKLTAAFKDLYTKAKEDAKAEMQSLVASEVKKLTSTDAALNDSLTQWRAANADYLNPEKNPLAVTFLQKVNRYELAGKLSSDPVKVQAQLNAIKARVAVQAELFAKANGGTATGGGKTTKAGSKPPAPTTGGGSRRTAETRTKDNQTANKFDALLGSKETHNTFGLI